MSEIMRRLDPHRTLSTLDRYRKKLKIVQEVIYGVDIQPIAVQITQLRLFLSLIQEIVPDKQKANYGIDPLPNLEIKFVCADALIGLEKKDKNGQGKLELPIIKETVKQLRETRSQYFVASSVQEKERLRKYDETLRKTLGIAMEDAGALTHGVAEKVVAWNPYDQFHSSPFFDSMWMFGIDKFDIVIGNPPYIQLQKSGGTLAKKYERSGYQTFTRMGDIYALFYERGWQLLVEGGHLCFVTSNKWMRTGYGKTLRKFLSVQTNPKLLIDFAGTKVFTSATVDVNILLFAKEKNRHQTSTQIIQDVANLKKIVKQQTMAFTSFPWVIMSPIEQSIKQKVEAVGKPLKKWGIRINFGIKTGFNDAFIVDGATKDALITKDPKSAEILKPILRGRDIDRYGYHFADLWLITTFPSLRIDINQYPAVKKHLLSFGKHRLEQSGKKGSRKKSNNKWFETQDTIAFWKSFNKPKMVWKRVGSILRFCFDDQNLLVLDSTCFATGKKLKYLVAVLNSKFGNYLMQHSPKTGTGDLLVSVQAIEPIKIPMPAIETEREIEKLLQNKDYAGIDRLVYDLYGLSGTEISFIENER